MYFFSFFKLFVLSDVLIFLVLFINILIFFNYIKINILSICIFICNNFLYSLIVFFLYLY